MKTLGQLIKEYREEHDNMSLRDFADKCGVSHAYIDKLEKGIDPRSGKPVVPTLDTVEKVSKALEKTKESVLKEIGFAFTNEDIQLTPKDEKNIEKDIEALKNKLLTGEGLMLNGEPATSEAIQSILDTMKIGMELAKQKNKEKYTPKKFRKDKNEG